MKCIYCQNYRTSVKDSRELSASIYRRRHCTACNRRFSTQEFVDGRKRPEDFTPELHIRRIRSSLMYLEEVLKKIKIEPIENPDTTQSIKPIKE